MPGYQNLVYQHEFYLAIILNFLVKCSDRYFHLADRVIKRDYGKVEYDRQN